MSRKRKLLLIGFIILLSFGFISCQEKNSKKKSFQGMSLERYEELGKKMDEELRRQKETGEQRPR
jgi:hypothetical protein